MNREIKFRAWDGKRMTTSGIMFNNSTGILEVPTSGSLGGNITNPYKIMQCTGLKDYNSIDLYEGDIVSYSGEIGVVTWSSLSGGFCIVRPNTEILTDWGIWFRSYGEMQVVGNIYENEELLTIKQTT